MRITPEGIFVSVAEAAEAADVTRETAGKRLRAAGVVAKGEARGRPTYRLRDCMIAIHQMSIPEADPNIRRRRDAVTQLLRALKRLEVPVAARVELDKLAASLADEFECGA